MRIISQDRTWDLQYESVVIKQVDNTILFSDYSLDISHVLACYSTSEDASNAMNMLQESYIAYESFKLMSEDQRTELTRSGLSPQEQKYLFGIFQFPQKEKLV